MLFYLTLIFACQLAGELIKLFLHLPVPGPVIGMVLLLVGLLAAKKIPADLARVGDALLSNLSLLFVPAGVGVMLHVALIGDQLVPIVASLVGSTLVTIGVTAVIMKLLSPAPADKE